MSKATSGKKVLIVNPATLTDRDGKSMRLIRFAQELKSMGNSVTIWAGKNLFSGVEFEVLAPSRNNKLLEYFGSDPYAPLTFELRNTFGMARNVAVPLIAEILSKAYQLVISSSVSPPLANLAALFACKIRGIPHVYDYDDLAPELTLMFKPSSIGELVRRIELTAESVIVRASNLVMTMSESMSAFLLRRTGRSSFAVYNTPSSRGLMNVPSKQESRRRHNLCQGEFIVGYIGNVQAEVRGLEHLIMVVPIA